MLIKDFTKITQIVPKNIKYHFYIFIFFLLISSAFELVSISALIPIAEILLNGKTSILFLDNFLNNFFNNFSELKYLNTILIGFLIIIILKSFFLIFFSYWTNKFSQQIYKSISTKLLKNYFGNKYHFFLNNKSSDLTRNVILETKNIGSIVFCYLKTITEIFIFFSIGILILFIDFKSSSILILSFSIFSALYFIFTKKIIYNFGLIRQKTTGSLLKILQEIFGSIKDIKLKSSENFFEKLYRNHLEKFISAAYKSNTINEIPRYLIEVIFIVIIFILIFINISSSGEIEKIISILAVYLAAGFRILPGAVKLNGYFQTIQSLKPSLDLLYKELIIDKMQIREAKKDNYKKVNLKKEILINNLSFSYGKKIIFKDINLKINTKSVLGIRGDSGSGKSTLINLLLGLLEPDKGSIMIDNKNINDFIFQWQSNIGYVSQNIFLLDSPLRENIAFGLNNDEIDYSLLDKVIKSAHLNKFISSLDNGVNTNIGEKGSWISGGQIQRIAIARELYKKPSILILDEATSGLDEKTEEKILNGIISLKNEMTIIIVSHNKNTLKFCDKIIDLNSFKLIN